MLRRSARAAANPFLRNAAYINGKFTEESGAGEPIKVYDPANNEVVGTVPACSKTQTEAAIDAAAAAQEEWAALLPAQRAKVLRQWAALMNEHKQPLAELLSLESGKPIADALGEQAYSAAFVDWYSGEAERIHGDVLPQFRGGVRGVVRKQPVGVVGIITPWNFPSAMITRSAAAALAAGCTVVIKPSDLTPLSATALAQLSEDAGVPKGVLNVVTGWPQDVGKAITGSFTVRKLCFTGSTRAGKILMAECVETVKKTAMEMGGNAPFIVFEDANLDLAVSGALAKFRNAGQICISPNRLYVHEKIHDEFVAKYAEATKKTMVVGHCTKEGVTMGPVMTKASADRLKGVINDAKAAGCTVAYSHQLDLTPEQEAAGQFVPPTIITGVKHGSEITQNEMFGPVAGIIKFSSTEEVLKMANDSRAGLASYFYTNDYKKQWQVAEKLKFGMVGINEAVISHPYAPFGGVKESGIGRDGSKYGIEGFLDIKYHLYGGNIDSKL